MHIEFHGDHIHVDHGNRFVISLDDMHKVWQNISEMCRTYDCGKVLIEGRAPERRMGTMEAFESGEEAAEIYPNLAVALCFYDYEPDEMSDLFVTAARNRGARVKFFHDRETAKRWLGVG